MVAGAHGKPWREIGENLVRIMYDRVTAYVRSVYPDRERQAKLLRDIASLSLYDIADDYLPEHRFSPESTVTRVKYRLAKNIEVDKQTLLHLLYKMPPEVENEYTEKLRGMLLDEAASLHSGVD